MNKTSIFTAYAVLCLVAFAGVSVLSITGKIGQPIAVTAFFAFYGFLSTTALFYLLGKGSVAIDQHDRNLQEEIRHVHSRIDEFNEKTQNDIYRIWDNIETIRDTPSSKR